MLQRNAIVAAAIIAVAAIALAGCGGGGSSTSGTTPLTTLPSGDRTTPGGATLKVFLVKGDTVTQVVRQVAGGGGGARQALEEMLKGPAASEAAQGISTAIPAGTTLLSYKVESGTATADFSKEMLNYGGGSARVQAIIGQIDNTVTGNDPSVRTVTVTVEGKPAEESLQP
jgi:spore germination protein GerM